jgi:hypothetical protein
MLLKKRQRSEKRNKLLHLFAAIIIIFHGFEKIESDHIHSAIFFLCSGTVFLLLAIFHHKIAHRLRSVDAIFSIIEGLLAVTVSIDFFNEHKHYIQYAYILAAVVYFVRAFILFRKAPTHVA